MRFTDEHSNLIEDMLCEKYRELKRMEAIEALLNENNRLKLDNNELKHYCNELSPNGIIYHDVDKTLLT